MISMMLPSLSQLLRYDKHDENFSNEFLYIRTTHLPHFSLRSSTDKIKNNSQGDEQTQDLNEDRNDKVRALMESIPIGEDIVYHIRGGPISLSIINEGLGGTYLVDIDGYMAVFKPSDEEAGSHENPKKNFKAPRKGISPGEGYIREVAAYLMDHGNYAGVPITQLVEMEVNNNKKIGSLQRYVPNQGSLADYGLSLFDKDDIHKIAQLDIRLYNVDRNEENLLVTKEKDVYHLVPIDHAYSLPESLEDGTLFVWLNWKKTKEPMSEEMLEYIENIDIERDEQILRMLNFKEESIFIMKMSTLTLKIGAKSGCNFHEIALFLTRPSLKGISPLEETVRDAIGKGDYEEHFWENFNSILTKRLSENKR